jgi:hypothetical protein
MFVVGYLLLVVVRQAFRLSAAGKMPALQMLPRAASWHKLLANN